MDVETASIDRIEQQFVECECVIARARAEQMVLLREVDRRQAPTAAGCGSLREWVAGRLDVSPETARDLAATTHRLGDLPDVEDAVGGQTVPRPTNDQVSLRGSDSSRPTTAREPPPAGGGALTPRGGVRRDPFRQRLAALPPPPQGKEQNQLPASRTLAAARSRLAAGYAVTPSDSAWRRCHLPLKGRNRTNYLRLPGTSAPGGDDAST